MRGYQRQGQFPFALSAGALYARGFPDSVFSGIWFFLRFNWFWGVFDVEVIAGRVGVTSNTLSLHGCVVMNQWYCASFFGSIFRIWYSLRQCLWRSCLLCGFSSPLWLLEAIC